MYGRVVPTRLLLHDANGKSGKPLQVVCPSSQYHDTPPLNIHQPSTYNYRDGSQWTAQAQQHEHLYHRPEKSKHLPRARGCQNQGESRVLAVSKMRPKRSGKPLDKMHELDTVHLPLTVAGSETTWRPESSRHKLLREKKPAHSSS